MTATRLKPLPRARLWCALWSGAIALVVLLSLVPAQDLPGVPSGGDKLEHFLAYAVLAAGAVQLFMPRAALGAGGGLVLLGIALEWAQFLFTSTRMMEGLDALADALGVLAGLGLLLSPWHDALLRFDRRSLDR